MNHKEDTKAQGTKTLTRFTSLLPVHNIGANFAELPLEAPLLQDQGHQELFAIYIAMVIIQ
jgi:hypothetical protein